MFVMHNPVRFIDPTGLFAEDPTQYVMLRYIIEKNGGSVFFLGGDAMINMPGFDFVWTTGNIVNGRMLVARHFLMETFMLSESQASHLPGDVFSTMNDAAMAFYLMHFSTSRDHWNERGAFIYRVWLGRIGRGSESVPTGFTFGTVFEGTHDHVIGGMVRNMFSNIGSLNSDISVASRVAMIHSHPDCSCHSPNVNNNFSSPDLRFGDISGFTMYLATPGRGLLRRDPRGETIEIR